MGRGRLDHSFEETPKLDEFEPLNRRSSIDNNQEEEERFFTSPLTGNERHVIHRGGDQNMGVDQILHGN